jgi:glycosyltransferase involved in cell wall biosynthesis
VKLSIIIPVYNEVPHLPSTIEALIEAVAQSDFSGEIILVDDGSTDRSAEVAQRAVAGRLPLKVLSSAHGGRFKARRAGLEAARSEWVLMLDSRARLHSSSLKFVHQNLTSSSGIWNGHVTPQTEGNPFGAFGEVLVRLAWARYFDNPKTTSFGLEDFDHYPKGMGCLLAPRTLLLESMAAFAPRIPDWRFVSDDTQLLRSIAADQRIHVSPEFGCDYQPRTTLSAFLRNAVYRGSTFLDGHGRRESRFYPVAVAFFPISATLTLVVVRRPAALLALVGASVVGATAVATRARRSRFETASFALLMPIYAGAHGLGMWRGLFLVARERFTKR